MLRQRRTCHVRCSVPAVASLALSAAVMLSSAHAQSAPGHDWSSARRCSWLRRDAAQPGDVVLVAPGGPAPVLVVGAKEHSCVRRAVAFLAEDLKRIGGVAPVVAESAPENAPCIVVATKADDPRWEAYDIVADGRTITVRGSNARGTAFGVYELCERLGVDPLHWWSGLEPEKVAPLVVRKLQHSQGPPAIRFRGLFHDDEDILPEPRAGDNVPDKHGFVPMAWYERFFETALRLRMNMVAPWVRVTKPYAVQKKASEWGLFYTSHHYDTLLSDPYHFERVPMGETKGLAAQRGVEPKWDWEKNKDGLVRFWRGGVEQNKDLDCIWPVGMRGTNDYAYKFPQQWSEEQKLAAYREAIETQVALVEKLAAPGHERLFHFTMYTEMLGYFQGGRLPVPENVIIVWPDDNDGKMRGLPKDRGKHKHGVYYHLAYLGGTKTAQTAQVVPPHRIEEQFRAILAAGCTEFFLTNVSELREYVLGIRMLGDLMWDGPELLHAEAPRARDFLAWWGSEYFGAPATDAVAAAYAAYFDLLPEARAFHLGAEKCLGALGSLEKKLAGQEFTPARKDTLPALVERGERQKKLAALLERARGAIAAEAPRRFFFENLELPAAIDRGNVAAATLLVRAMDAHGKEAAVELCKKALVELDAVEAALRKAERQPFTAWYGPTWIAQRNQDLVEPRRGLVKLLANAAR